MARIRYLDGHRLRNALVAGYRNLARKASYLDSINVFPVPDGDTGTNMAGTLRSVAGHVASRGSRHFGETLQTAARSALSSARGNSGSIIAQFFHLLAQELAGHSRVAAMDIARAARKASKATRAALSDPRDGTILTVLDEWSAAFEHRSMVSTDFHEILHHSLESARTALEATRGVLPEMRKAGVVDAGAMGFVDILEGISDLVDSGSLREIAGRREEAETETELHAPLWPEGDITSGYRYCVEAIVNDCTAQTADIQGLLCGFGDSVVVAGGKGLSRIHVHTDSPSDVFDALDATGGITDHKIDDMFLQRRIRELPRKACAVVVDSACDLPESTCLEQGLQRVAIQIQTGGVFRPDVEGMSISSLYARMRSDPGFSLTTSQPQGSTFARAFDLALSNADEVLYLGVSGALSGTLEAGRLAATRGGARIHVVDSLTISAGTGLLALRALRAAERGAGAAEISGIIAQLRPSLRFMVAIPGLEGLIRSGRVSGVKAIMLRKLGIRPILETGRNGRAEASGLFWVGPSARITDPRTIRAGSDALFSRIRKAHPEGSDPEILIGHVDAEAEARRLAERCTARFACSRPVAVVPIGPALAGHAGLGTLVAATLPG